MSLPDFYDLVTKGGAYVSPLLLAAILWLNADRNRLLSALKERDDKLESLSERHLVVMTELKTWLFSEQRGKA